MKILAVDDDDLILDLLVESLSKHGFDDIMPVDCAQNALDLIEALDGESQDEEQGSFDCFLLDIEMPGMNGIELCRTIRAMPAYRRTPILMVTTLSDRGNIEKAFAAGATDYINKPFDEIEVGSRIRLADMLVREQRRGLQAYFAATALFAGADLEKNALFQSPITVEGVDKVVDLLVLENFLLQLSRKDLHQSTAVAFKYSEAKSNFDQMTESEFYEQLEIVAQVISNSFGEAEVLISYFGSGLYVAVMDRATTQISEGFAKIVNGAAIEAGLMPVDGGLAVVVGDPVENPIHRRNDIHTMLLDAVSSAAEKSVQADPKAVKVKPLSAKALKYNYFHDK
jgi:CheY-like chemotaxis protein